VIFLIGISHKSAPIEVRERIALSEERASELVASLVQGGHASEAFVVSTCNRVEVVMAAPSPADGEQARAACLTALCAGDRALETYAYAHADRAALRHITRVAASLDSMVVGEPQILGQIKQGFEWARSRGTVGAELHQVFSRAVRGARRIRTETGIGAGQVSVPAIAIQLANQVFGDMSGHVALLIGSGEMGQAVARLLKDAGAQLMVAGRSLERVSEVTSALGGSAHLMSDLPALLKSADVVVSSTSAPSFVVSREVLDQTRRQRRGRHLLAIDLAVPRDIEPSAGELDGVFLYNIDDLASVAAQAHKSRQQEAERAEKLVEEVVLGWERAQTSRQATPTIKALRARIGTVLQTELDKSLRGRLRGLGDAEREALLAMLDASINRLLHRPTARLRELGAEADSEALDQASALLDDLFGLNDSADADDSSPERATPSVPPKTAPGQAGQAQAGQAQSAQSGARSRLRALTSTVPPEPTHSDDASCAEAGSSRG
jgi:glutamyl-tRNA reductase